MFSGIVAGTGKIISLKSNKDFMTLKVDPPKGFCKGLQKGASISVNGICLTSLNKGKNGLSLMLLKKRYQGPILKVLKKVTYLIWKDLLRQALKLAVI